MQNEDRWKRVHQLMDRWAQKFMVSWISKKILSYFFLICWLFFPENIWLEARSTNGPNRNQVYDISNTTIEDMWKCCNVSTIGSSQSRSSQQSLVVQANIWEQVQARTTQLSAETTQLRSKTTDLKDKVNVLEYLLTTLTDKCGQSHRPLCFR
jgi:hypothetical protein